MNKDKFNNFRDQIIYLMKDMGFFPSSPWKVKLTSVLGKDIVVVDRNDEIIYYKASVISTHINVHIDGDFCLDEAAAFFSLIGRLENANLFKSFIELRYEDGK